MTSQEYAQQIALILNEKKAENIVVIDITDKSVLADYFVIASGRNHIHVKSLSEEVEEKMDEMQPTLPLRRTEGKNEGRWIVLDYADILVHVFHPEEREYYNIERLWADNENIKQFIAD